MIKILLLSFICLFLFSCGQSAKEKTDDAVQRANIFLTQKKCQPAIDILEAVGHDNYNGKYLETLASAYACRAGYSTLTFFLTDVKLVGNPAPLGGLTRFTLASKMDSPTASSFTDLQKAIDTLLYAGGIPTSSDPSSAKRANALPSADAMDIDAFLMYMVLTQMGQYLYYYGDSSATGVKASGPGTNKCIASYTDVTLDVGAHAGLTAFLGAGLTGSCNVIGSGHPQMGLNVDRLCQGVVLLNNFLDIFPSVLSAVTSSDLDTVDAVTAAITAAKTAMLTAKTNPQMAVVANTRSQEKCVADNTADTQYLQVYMAFMYEVLFQ